MMNALTISFVFFLVSTSLLAFITWKIKCSIILNLKNNHADEYERLLLSDSLDDNEIEKQKLFSLFINKKEFNDLNDDELYEMCKKYVLTGRLFSLSVLVLLANALIAIMPSI